MQKINTWNYTWRVTRVSVPVLIKKIIIIIQKCNLAKRVGLKLGEEDEGQE